MHAMSYFNHTLTRYSMHQFEGLFRFYFAISKQLHVLYTRCDHSWTCH